MHHIFIYQDIFTSLPIWLSILYTQNCLPKGQIVLTWTEVLFFQIFSKSPVHSGSPLKLSRNLESCVFYERTKKTLSGGLSYMLHIEQQEGNHLHSCSSSVIIIRQSIVNTAKFQLPIIFKFNENHTDKGPGGEFSSILWSSTDPCTRVNLR